MITEYNFGAWLPDRQDFRNPGLEDVRNVIPGVSGYGPARAFVGGGSSVSGTIIGAASSYLQDGAVVVFVATTADLYVIRSGSVAASSLSLSLGASDRVVFEQFKSAIYATTKNGDTWVLSDVSSDSSFATSAGSPPSANAIGRVGDFLVMGDLTDIDANNAPFRIRWSRFNNPQGAWDTDLGAQSGAQELDQEFGPVTAITGGAIGLIFQTRGVTRISPNGGPAVFNLVTFEKNRGCVAPGSAVQVGETTYYLAHDGFFRTDGTSPQSISTGKVWDWFSGNANRAFLSDVVGSVDYERRCIVWAFSTTSERTFDTQLWYSWEVNEWGNVIQALDRPIEGAQSGISLEELDALYGSLENVPVSLDSPEFSASGRNLMAIAGGELGALTGGTLEGYLAGGDIHPNPGKRSFVDEVYPLIKSPAASVAIVSRNTMQAALMETAPVAVGSIGFAPFNHDARYYRVKVILPAGAEWSDAYGYQVNSVQSGAA